MVRKLIVGRNNGYYIRKRGGEVIFTPNALPGLLQYVDSLNYSVSTLAFYPYFTSSKTGETAARPRGARCVLFDGVNDYGIAPATLISGAGDFTVTAYVKASNVSTASNTVVSTINGGNATGFQFYVFSSKINYFANGSNLQGATVLSNSVWYHVAVTRISGTVTLYVNGVADGTASNSASLGALGNLSVGAYSALEHFGGCIYDVRAYSVGKTPAQIAAIYNQHLTPDTVDTANALAIWPLQEEAGVTGYDIIGNNDLTYTNATVPTPFHTTDTGVKWSFPNQKGYTLSGSTIIPASLINTGQDAAAGALQNTGPILLPITTEVPCITGDAAAVVADLAAQYVPTSGNFEVTLWAHLPTSPGSFASLLGQTDGAAWGQAFIIYYETAWKVAFGNYAFTNVVIPGIVANAWNYIRVRKVGTTLFASANGATESSVSCASSITPTDNTKLLNNAGGVAVAARISDVRIIGATTFYLPCQDGSGGSNTNRNLAWARSDGTGGIISNAISGGTVSAIWTNRCPYGEDWSVKYGGRIGAAGEFILGKTNGSGAVDGNALTGVATKLSNPYSRINFNVFGAPSLNNINAETAYAITTARQSVAPNDTKFRRTKTDGDDRFFSTISALTGADLTNANAYVA